MNNQRIGAILNQLLEQTREQVLPTVYSATMLAGLQELQSLKAGIEAQRAFAQQAAQAAPAVRALLHSDSVPDDFRNQASGYRAGWNDCLAAAPAAPLLLSGQAMYQDAAGTIPVTGIGQPVGLIVPAAPVAQGQWPSGCPCNSAPGPCENCSPAAEQPDTVAVPRAVLADMAQDAEDSGAQLLANRLRALLAGGAE